MNGRRNYSTKLWDQDGVELATPGSVGHNLHTFCDIFDNKVICIRSCALCKNSCFPLLILFGRAWYLLVNLSVDGFVISYEYFFLFPRKNYIVYQWISVETLYINHDINVYPRLSVNDLSQFITRACAL